MEEAFSKNNWGECAPKVARATAAKDAVVLTWSFQQCLAAAQTCEWSDPDIEALYSDTLPPPQNYVSTSTADALGIEVYPSATPANVSLCDSLLSLLRMSECKKDRAIWSTAIAQANGEHSRAVLTRAMQQIHAAAKGRADAYRNAILSASKGLLEDGTALDGL